MKKLKPIVKILIVLVLVLVLVLSLMFFIKINKKVYTANNITTIFEKNNLVVNDNMASIDDKNVDAYIEARNDQSTFRIEFYKFDNEKSAKKFYKDNTNSLENETGGIQGKVVTNKMGFYKYTLEASGNYVTLIRSKNTIIFVNTNEKNKDLVDSIIKSLKY